jgi:glucose/mannose-6-phosphate isomerase
VSSTERLRELDAEHQLDAVLALPDHLRDALWRVESTRLEPAPAAGVAICGMGGSAIGGDLAAAAIGERRTLPFCTVRDYGLPPTVTAEWTLLCSSFSGNTEETLACFDAGAVLEARIIAATSGGLLAEKARAAGAPVVGLPGILPSPRTAVAYMFTVAAEVAALAGAAPSLRGEIEAAANALEGARDGIHQRAQQLAARLEGTTPVIYGADLTAPAAMRWKTEVNENTKIPAFHAELPEADHNEIEGWPGSPPGAFSAVFLEDRDQHPRIRRRIEVTAETIEPNAAAVVRLQTEGETRPERLLWAVMLGDLVSLHLAAGRGVDPTPIEAIEAMKRKLGPA